VFKLAVLQRRESEAIYLPSDGYSEVAVVNKQLHSQPVAGEMAILQQLPSPEYELITPLSCFI